MAYDRRKELEEFDATKLGVKGLVDSGITRIPRIFHHPPDSLLEPDLDHEPIPVIDMLGLPHSELVGRIRDASAKFGFFQVTNHGVPVSLLDRLLSAVKAFHELPAEEKSHHYRRGETASTVGVGFYSNVDLFVSNGASWRDTLEIRLGSNPLDPAVVPDVCRDVVMEWDKEVKQLSERLIELLCEGLGLSPNKLKEMDFLGQIGMVGHYYPYCPEPNKTVGIASHTDREILTMVLQDQVGGLQVKYGNKWVDVKPLHGALVVNIGDLFQMISNDKYKSAEHRVNANPSRESRVSVAIFMGPRNAEMVLGPLPELISAEKPTLYQQFKLSDYVTRLSTKEIDGKSGINYFRL